MPSYAAASLHLIFLWVAGSGRPDLLFARKIAARRGSLPVSTPIEAFAHQHSVRSPLSPKACRSATYEINMQVRHGRGQGFGLCRSVHTDDFNGRSVRRSDEHMKDARKASKGSLPCEAIKFKRPPAQQAARAVGCRKARQEWHRADSYAKDFVKSDIEEAAKRTFSARLPRSCRGEGRSFPNTRYAASAGADVGGDRTDQSS